jgi:hypothetical protein
MALTMRPTGLGHGVYKDDIDFGVFSGEWLIGRIYEQKGPGCGASVRGGGKREIELEPFAKASSIIKVGTASPLTVPWSVTTTEVICAANIRPPMASAYSNQSKI